ncbi:MAG: hypothetical protein ACI39R_01650 [Lachnospiraceae bacterium]
MAQNIDYKKSTLDDDASIYQKKEDRDETKSAKQKWSSMNGKEKKQYFKDYMLKPLLLGVFLVGIVIYLIYTIVFDASTTRFYLAVVGSNYMDNAAMEEHLDELAETWNFSKKEKAVYNPDVAMGSGGFSDQSTFVTYLYAGSMNAVIGTKDQLEKYGYYFTDYTSELPEDVLAQIPEEAWCELTYETNEPDTKQHRTESSYCALYLKYTVFADDIKDTKNTDNLILVFPLTGSEDKDTINRNMDFFLYALGIESKK